MEQEIKGNVMDYQELSFYHMRIRRDTNTSTHYSDEQSLFITD